MLNLVQKRVIECDRSVLNPHARLVSHAKGRAFGDADSEVDAQPK